MGAKTKKSKSKNQINSVKSAAEMIVLFSVVERKIRRICIFFRPINRCHQPIEHLSDMDMISETYDFYPFVMIAGILYYTLPVFAETLSPAKKLPEPVSTEIKPFGSQAKNNCVLQSESDESQLSRSMQRVGVGKTYAARANPSKNSKPPNLGLSRPLIFSNTALANIYSPACTRCNPA